MIWKMNPPKLFLFLLSIFLGVRAEAGAPNRFECLRDLLPVTAPALLQKRRVGFEEPFMVGESRYMVFPEVADGKLRGFFIYDRTQAWHYDGMEDGSSLQDLHFDSAQGILELVAQPNGLETVRISYLPGYNPRRPPLEGAAMLGSSVLPVVGALVSRPGLSDKIAYHNPDRVPSSDLKAWFQSQAGGRAPASASASNQELTRTLRRLRRAPSRASDWRPLESELQLRRTWIRSHNLDEKSFRQFNRLMQTTCGRMDKGKDSEDEAEDE